MSRYLTILFLITSLAVGLNSCSPPLKGFSPLSENAVVFKPVFNNDFERVLYRFQANFKKNQLTGILLVKKIPGLNSYRTVFMSETGLKYFDFEFFPNNTVEVHHVMDALDKKALVKIITSDFILLFNSEIDKESLKVFQSVEEKDEQIVYFKQDGKYYYKYNGQNLPPQEVEKRSCFAPRTNIEILSYQENILESLLFTHGFLGYTMKLELINQ